MAKPNFRVGQIVCKRDNSHPRFCMVIRNSRTKTLCDLSDGTCRFVSELRPLTAREIGQPASREGGKSDAGTVGLP